MTVPGSAFAASVGACWESGGPEWLFGAALWGVGLAAIFGAVALVAWMPVDVLASGLRPRGRRWIWFVLALATSALASRLPIGSLAAPLSFVLVGLAGMQIGEQAARDGSAPRPTSARRGTLLHVLRWGSLGAAACASAVAVQSAAAMLALGHPC